MFRIWDYIRIQWVCEDQQPTRQQRQAIGHSERGHHESSIKDRGQNPQPVVVSALWADRAHSNPPHQVQNLPSNCNDSALTRFYPDVLLGAATYSRTWRTTGMTWYLKGYNMLQLEVWWYHNSRMNAGLWIALTLSEISTGGGWTKRLANLRTVYTLT